MGVNAPGWPRPWTTWVDRDEQWQVPVPWVAGESLEPEDVDEQRLMATREQAMCQVCGEEHNERQERVRVRSPDRDWDNTVLHRRCWLLARRYCPHFGGRGVAQGPLAHAVELPIDAVVARQDDSEAGA